MDKKDIRRYAFIAVLTVVVCVTIQYFSIIMNFFTLALKSLRPMIVGCIIAYILNIVMSFFEKHYFPKKTTGFVNATRRPVCLIIAFAITVAIIALVLNIIIPEIIKAGKLVYAAIPEIFTKVKDFILEKLNEYPDIQKQINEIEIDKSAAVKKLPDWAFGVFSSAITVIGWLTSAITSVVIGIIFAIYLLLRKDKIAADIKRFQRMHISEKINNRVNYFLATAHETFTSFFIGQFVEAILIGTLTFIGASILRLPYAAMTGTIIGVTALIPIVGALAGAAISAFLICTVSMTQALVFLIFLIILQQLDNNILYPKVVGSSIGLPGIWVLAAVTVGGGLFGIMGMLLGVPLAATIYKLYFEHLENSEKELGIFVDAAEKVPAGSSEKSKKPEKPTKKKQEK